MRRIIQAFLLVFLGYLCQVCIMPYLAIGGITANILFSVIAIATVAYSRFFTFGIAGTAGILMEVMTASIPNLKLIGYAAIGMLGSFIFSDKSERRLEQERSEGKAGKNLNAHLRTVLCALFDISLYETIHLVFVYLNGVNLGWTQAGRALLSMVYTVGVTALIMIPVRYSLGMYSKSKERQQAEISR